METKIELFIPGDLKEEPIICYMIKEFQIELKIMEASFSTESGWAYLKVKGEKAEMDRMFGELRNKGISVEIRET